MRPHPDARRWSQAKFKAKFEPVKPVNGQCLMSGRKDSICTLAGYLNEYPYLHPNGLVCVVVRGPTAAPWAFTKFTEESYGLNPDGTTYAWRPGPDRR